MNFDGIIKNIQKAIGNFAFPQQKQDVNSQLTGQRISNQGDRGALGNFLASKYYEPPIVSPVAPPVANQGVPQGIYNTTPQDIDVNQPGLTPNNAPSAPANFQEILGAAATPTPTPTDVPYPTPTLLPGAPPNPYMDMIKNSFSPDQANNASNVMFKESGNNPLSYNTNSPIGGSGVATSLQQIMDLIDQYPKTDVGPYQINNYWQRENLPKAGYSIEDMVDPQKSIEYAAWLQAKNGWNPWYAARGLGLTQ